MASEDVQTNLRLPADLKERLQSSATENNRSLSAEVASRLEESFSPHEAGVTLAQFNELVSQLKGVHEQNLMSVSLIRDVLASYVTRLYQVLSAEDQTKPEFINMVDMAASAISRDAKKMAKAFERSMAERGGSDVAKFRDFFEDIAADNARAGDRRRELLDRNA